MNRTNLLVVGALLLAATTACTKDDGETAVPDPNNPPTADAGADHSVTLGERVTLDASGSFDPDGDTLFYDWSFETIPSGSTITDAERPLSNNGTSNSTTVFTPDAVGTYVLSLSVHDQVLRSDTDFVVVSVTASDDEADRPIADAGSNQQVAVGDSVTLDGSSSYDPKGGSLTYAWTLLEVPALSSLTSADVSGMDADTATFTADAYGVYSFSLTVDNGVMSSKADLVSITALGDSEVPVANAGEDQAGEDCSTIQLDGSGSADADGDALTYKWEVQQVPSGSSVTDASISDTGAESPTFYADVSGVYVLSLTVYDGINWSPPETVTLTLEERTYNTPPSVTLTAPGAVEGGYACCEVDGYGYDCDECGDQDATLTAANVIIADADGDPYTVEWADLTEGDVTIDDPTSENPTMTMEDVFPSEPGVCDTLEYEVQITVTDCTGESTTTSMVISSECCGADSDDTTTDCSE